MRRPTKLLLLAFFLGCSSAEAPPDARQAHVALAGATRFEETSSAIHYDAPWSGTWYMNKGANFSAGGHATHMDAGARATLSFNGTAVTWLGLEDPWSGIAAVYLDGVRVASVDTYASSARYQVPLYTNTALAPGAHTLAIEATQTKNAASAGFWVSVDAFDVVQSAAVTCALTASSDTVQVGQSFSMSLSVSAPAASAAFFGTKNGAPEGPAPIPEWPSGGTAKTVSYPTSAGTEGGYTRYVVFKDAAGATLCTTAAVPLAIVTGGGGGGGGGGSSLGCAGLTDGLTHSPPTSGPYAYGTFLPSQPGFVARGQSYVDPVFGCSVRRLSNVFPGWGNSAIYSKNGFWNADGSLYMQSPNAQGQFDVVSGESGAVVRANVPFGSGEGSFDPVDPDTFYYWGYQTSELRRYSVSAGTSTVVKAFPAPLESLGGSVDFIDRTGRYFLLSYGGQLHIWDKASDVIYSGSVPNTFGTGWAGISPDGKYIIVGGHNGQEFQHWSFAVDHAGRAVSSAGVMFWSLCGPHSDIASASDGKTYLAGFDCYDEPAIYRVDVSIAQSTTDVAKQKSDNVRLFGNDWNDSGHFSCASKGPRQDWCFAEIASGDDTFASMGAWRPYKQEIVAMQMVPPYTVQRLAHHRSRSPFSSYVRQPRANATWDGTKVAFASDYGYDSGANAYSDVFFVDLR